MLIRPQFCSPTKNCPYQKVTANSAAMVFHYSATLGSVSTSNKILVKGRNNLSTSMVSSTKKDPIQARNSFYSLSEGDRCTISPTIYRPVGWSLPTAHLQLRKLAAPLCPQLPPYFHHIRWQQQWSRFPAQLCVSLQYEVCLKQLHDTTRRYQCRIDIRQQLVYV